MPGIEARLRRELVAFVQPLRALDLRKVPSICETVDWARALVLLHAAALDPDLVRDTLNVLLKFEQDIEVAGKQIAGPDAEGAAGGGACRCWRAGRLPQRATSPVPPGCAQRRHARLRGGRYRRSARG